MQIHNTELSIQYNYQLVSHFCFQCKDFFLIKRYKKKKFKNECTLIRVNL